MKYEVQLNNGKVYILSGADFDAQEIANQLNTQSVTFVNFGNVVVNKHIVIGIFPVQEEVPVAEGK